MSSAELVGMTSKCSERNAQKQVSGQRMQWWPVIRQCNQTVLYVLTTSVWLETTATEIQWREMVEWMSSRNNVSQRFMPEIHIISIVIDINIITGQVRTAPALYNFIKISLGQTNLLRFLFGSSFRIRSHTRQAQKNPAVNTVSTVIVRDVPNIRLIFYYPVPAKTFNETGYCNRIFYLLNEYWHQKI